jgi:hypothetical protein
LKNVFLVFVFLLSVFISGCSKSDNEGALLTNKPSWTLKLGDKNYSWSGPFPSISNNISQAIYSSTLGLNPTAIIALAKSANPEPSPLIITIELSSVNTGTFNMNPSTYPTSTTNGNSMIITLNDSSSTIYSTSYPGSNIVFKVNSLSEKSFLSTRFTSYGFVTGEFTGKIADVNGVALDISGKFNAVRNQ